MAKNYVPIISVALGVIIAVISVVVAATRVESKVESQGETAARYEEINTAAHDKFEKTDVLLDDQCDKLNDGVARLEIEMKYLREDTKEILLYIKELRK